jgi:hypothetical protein
MDKQLILMGAATILAGIHGNNGNHTAEQIKKAVDVAVAIAKEIEALQPQAPPAQ